MRGALWHLSRVFLLDVTHVPFKPRIRLLSTAAAIALFISLLLLLRSRLLLRLLFIIAIVVAIALVCGLRCGGGFRVIAVAVGFLRLFVFVVAAVSVAVLLFVAILRSLFLPRNPVRSPDHR